MYIEIINNQIIKNHDNLPKIYKNISNFFALEESMLRDLTWSGNPGVKFYPYVEQTPENIPPNTKLIGPIYTIDDENFVVIGTFETVPADPPEVPNSISARQIRLWLVQNGIPIQNILNAINNIQDPIVKESVSIEWEYAPYIERTHPMLVPIAQQLGLSESDIDQAFIEASQI